MEDTVYGQDSGLPCLAGWRRSGPVTGADADRGRRGATHPAVDAAVCTVHRGRVAGRGPAAPACGGWPQGPSHVRLGRCTPARRRARLAHRSVTSPTDQAYYLTNVPPETLLGTLARVAASRWPIEQAFDGAEGESGLDHYEVCRRDSWHRHTTLSLLAHTFLADLRRREAGEKWAAG